MIFEHIDYRQYLKSYLDKKNGEPYFSLRQFSSRAGISTPNYLKLVAEGKKNLGAMQAEKFIRGLRLTNSEANYFRAMVNYSMSRDLDSQEFWLKRMQSLRSRKKLSYKKDNILIKEWYHVVIWELASCKDFNLTSQNIVKALRKKITLTQAKKALEFMVKNGYLIKKDDTLKPAEESLKTSNGIPNPTIRRFNKEMGHHALKAIDEPLKDRVFQGLTVAVQKDKLPEIRERIRRFKKELHKELANDREADSVYHINLQCFKIADTENL